MIKIDNLIPLNTDVFNLESARYDVLTKDTAKFLIAYWYGRVNCLKDDVLIENKNIVSFLKAYDAFLRVLYASGVPTDFIVDYIENYLEQFIIFLSKESYKEAELDIEVYFVNNIIFYLSITSNMKIEAEIKNALNKVYDNTEDNHIKFFIELFNDKSITTSINDLEYDLYKAILSQEEATFDDLLKKSVFDSHKKAINVFNENKISKYFLSQTMGFYDFSFEALENGYKKLYNRFKA